MNKQTEALELAIEAMENSIVYREDLHHAKKDQHKYTEPCPVEQRWNATIQACKEALDTKRVCENEEQPAQEPVASVMPNIHRDGSLDLESNSDVINAFLPPNTKLYTHPAPSWQGLSDDEIWKIDADLDDWGLLNLARAIEQALKEKNIDNYL